MSNLRRVVTIAFDPSQEIGKLEAGPVFTDEYSSLVVSDDPSDTENLLRLDGIQEELVTDYLTEWSRVATHIAEQENLELYVVVGASDDDDTLDALANTLRDRISAHVRVHGSGDAWFVTSTHLNTDADQKRFG